MIINQYMHLMKISITKNYNHIILYVTFWKVDL